MNKYLFLLVLLGSHFAFANCDPDAVLVDGHCPPSEEELKQKAANEAFFNEHPWMKTGPLAPGDEEKIAEHNKKEAEDEKKDRENMELMKKNPAKWERENLDEDDVKENACQAYQSVAYAQMRIDGLMKIEQTRDLSWDEGQDLIRNRRVIRNDMPRWKNLIGTYKRLTKHVLTKADCENY